MKTTFKPTEAKRTLTTLFSLLVFVNAVIPQPLSINRDNEFTNAVKELDGFANRTEQSIKYIAPTAERQDLEQAINRMKNLTDGTEQSTQYIAPAADEFTSTDRYNSENAVERLDKMANATEKSLEYKTSAMLIAGKQDASDEVCSAYNRLDVLANNTEASIKFKSPASDVTYTDAICESYKEREALDRLDEYTAATEKSLQFRAPAAEVSQQKISENPNEVTLLEKILDDNSKELAKNADTIQPKEDRVVWSWFKENILDELKTEDNLIGYPQITLPKSKVENTPLYQNTSF